MGGEKATLEEIGQHVGAALIAFDCASDWHQDSRRGNFNPLMNLEPVKASVEYSKMSLQRGRDICERRFGYEAGTVKLLEDVANSIMFQPENSNSVTDCLSSKPVRVGTIGGLSGLLAGASDNGNSDAGACCCFLIAAAAISSACGNQVTAAEGKRLLWK